MATQAPSKEHIAAVMRVCDALKDNPNAFPHERKFAQAFLHVAAELDQAREREKVAFSYDCQNHGAWDARTVSGCPACVRELREENKALRAALTNIEETTQRRQLPITREINELAHAALASLASK